MPQNEKRSTKAEMVRWHLECIPIELDRQLRQRQLDNGRKYPCQQVVADLQEYYEILRLRDKWKEEHPEDFEK